MAETSFRLTRLSEPLEVVLQRLNLWITKPRNALSGIQFAGRDDRFKGENQGDAACRNHEENPADDGENALKCVDRLWWCPYSRQNSHSNLLLLCAGGLVEVVTFAQP